jgi:hypothetical protein
VTYIKHQRNLGDVQDWFSAGTASYEDQMRCIEKANASPLAKQVDARIEDLNLNWKPTGLYTSEQILKLMYELSTVTDAARSALLTVPQNSYGLTNARNYLEINDRRVAAYRAAATSSGGKKIPAPDLKKEYVKSLINVWNAYVTTAAIDCNLTTGQKMKQSIDRAIDAAKSVLGTVLAFAESAANAIKAPLDILGWLGKYPFVPVGIGAALLYLHIKKRS